MYIEADDSVRLSVSNTNVKNVVDSFNSLGEWGGQTPWLSSFTQELSKHYKELRQKISEVGTTGSYAQYCERVAFHFYDLACLYNEQLFRKHRISPESVARCAQKCLEFLAEIGPDQRSKKLMLLEEDANNVLSEANTPVSATGNNKQIDQNVNLLYVINTLEDAQTLSKPGNTVIIAEIYGYLGEAYKLAGLSALGDSYVKTAASLVRTFIPSSIEGDLKSVKQQVEDIIIENIKEKKYNLTQVEDVLRRKFQKPISSIDEDFISQKYMESCSDAWLKETAEYLESQSWGVLQGMFSTLDGISCLNNIPDDFQQFDYYTLLMQHYKLLNKVMETSLIGQFKKGFLQKLLSQSKSARLEFEFIESFVDFLKSERDLQSIKLKLKLTEFCNRRVPFRKFVKRILSLEAKDHGEALVKLKKAAAGLQQEEYLFFFDKFALIVKDYMKPVEMEVKSLDGRMVLEILGQNIVISEILSRVNEKLNSNPKIEEIRFIGTFVIHVDHNIEKEIWHGKNVVILTKNLRIHGKVAWDVSGNDNGHVYEENAGTGEDGDGKPGKDGLPGESGGNVLVHSDVIENIENFTVISNGGKGSKGQDGGDGENGKDGDNLSQRVLDYVMPPPAAMTPAIRVQKLKRILNNIKETAATIETVWCSTGQTTIDAILQRLDRIDEALNRAPGFFVILNVLTDFDANLFIEATTRSGSKVTFSYQYGQLLITCQAYLLYKGKPGSPGGDGGVYGLGGQGGYAGDVVFKGLRENINHRGFTNVRKNGTDGDVGKGGFFGSRGKNGWDIGYMDFWLPYPRIWPQYYGTDENSRLKIDYFSQTAPDRIWSPRHEQYAQMSRATIDHDKEKTYEGRKNTRENNERERSAKATRKKNISVNVSTYSNLFSAVESMNLQDLQANIDATQQNIQQTARDMDVEQIKQTTDLKVQRHVQFSDSVKRRTPKMMSEVVEDAIHGGEQENSCEQLKNDWMKLKSVELSISQLEPLFLITSTVQGSLDHEGTQKMELIEKLLIDKYRFAKLQQLANQFSLPEVSGNVDLPKDNYERYLVEGVNNHPIFESQEEFIAKNDGILQMTLQGFILEVGGMEGVNPKIKTIYDEYVEFDKAHQGRLNDIINKLNEELSEPKNKNLRDLWIQTLKDKAQERVFIEKIAKIKSLKAIYSQFQKEMQTEFPWDETDALSLTKELTSYIKEKGLLSGSCREALALAHSTNVRIYADDPFRGLHLIDNHNPQSEFVLHILYGANKFTQLKNNENYLKLDATRKIEDAAYGKILTTTDLFYNKQDLDDYLKNVDATATKNVSGCKEFFNEEEATTEIGKFFPQHSRQLEQRLEMVSKYAGGKEILRYMLLRLSSEGKRISYVELSCFINSVVASFIEERKMQNIYCWIIAAHSQQNWIDELTLLHLENYFQCLIQPKTLWREYLSKITNKNIVMLMGSKLSRATSLSVQCVEETLFLLSSIPDEDVSLEGLELSEWPYVLKETFWLYKLRALTDWQDSEKLPVACYYLLSMDNTFGPDLVGKLLEALKKKQNLSPAVLTEILSNFYHEKWNLSDEEITILHYSALMDWIEKMKQKFSPDGKVRDLDALLKLIQNNENTSSEIAHELPDVADLIKAICRDGYVIKGKAVAYFSHQDITDWAKEVKSTDFVPKNENIIEMLAMIVQGILKLRDFRLRDTQLLTVAALLTNRRSTLAQVATGEGKSLIVVAASIIKALMGQKVDAITSSSVLAKRDAEENKDIYNMFGINVSHNCNEDIEKRKEAYSSNDVVYGDLSNFQRDYLLDRFYGKNVFGDHNFSNIIVDEVDSMLLDKGNNMLYLSHDLAGLDKLESLYIFIWQWINQPAADIEEARYAFNVAAIKDAVLRDMYGLVKLDDLNKLGAGITQMHKTTIWERLVKDGFISLNGTVESDSVDFNKLSEVVSSEELVRYKDRLHFMFKEIVGREKRINAPKSLRDFIDSHLDCWIRSAVNAYFMKPGQDYVVDVDRSGTSSDRDANITILDRDTGTDQANSQWDEGLHQFLQLKHGCRISLQSLKAVFISNVSFFKLYDNLYGLTGTLGSKIERDLLRNMYKVDFVTIPTALAKRFGEDEPILCVNGQHWIQEICQRATTLTVEHKRSVLIICDTVNDVQVLGKEFRRNNVPVHMYVRDYEELEIAKGDNRLHCGEIIIATNLAGRGTDIKIAKTLKDAGGLHVLLTYLPSNIRIEQQAFGRTARSGDDGSGQLIAIDPSGHQYSFLRVIDLKKERNVEEIHRLSEIKNYYETQITMEESCFKAFKEQYERLKNKLSNDQVPQPVTDILLQSCLDKWAFWLDKNSKLMKNAGDDQSKKSVKSLLNEFIKQFQFLRTGFGKRLWLYVSPIEVTEYNSSAWRPWVKGNPTQMIKLATHLCQSDDHKNARKSAIKLLDEVIRREPSHSEAARYYKAFTLAKGIDWEQKPFTDADRESFKEFKKELLAAGKLFNDRANFSIIASGVIGMIKKNSVESIIQVDSYEEQKKCLASFYDMFSRTLNDICGHVVSPQDFLNFETNQGCAEILFNDLLEKGIVEKPRVNKSVSNKTLSTISNDYGFLTERLTDFLYNRDVIDEKKIKKELKKAITLPGREAFWRTLVSHKVLVDEIKYVAVDTDRLQDVEPSEFHYFYHQLNKKAFEDQAMTLDAGYAILYSEWISQDGTLKHKNIYKEKDLIYGLGKDAYEILKKRQCLFVNKVAKFASKDFSSMVLSYYDSITVDDMTEKLGIVQSDAEQIITLLVANKVLEARNKTSYALKINFDGINRISLPSFPVYENAIKGLLSSCFIYRIALQKIEKQYNEKAAPLRVPLVSKPHQRLYMDLIDREVVIPPMASSEDAHLEDKLKRMYTKAMTKDALMDMLSKYVPAAKQCRELLFNMLLDKKWITQLITFPKISAFSMVADIPAIKTLENQLTDYYGINEAESRLPLDFTGKDGHRIFRIYRTVEMILDCRLNLHNEDTIKYVMSSLKRSTGSLKSLKVPDSKLKPLAEIFSEFEFGNAEELHLFYLNGLTHLLQFEEKRWSREMIRNTAIVIAMGVAQIAIGVAIELWSLGAMTHVGAAFINEGVSDLFFAAGCIRSGYFSWEDYRQHKIQSLMITAATAGLGYCLSSTAEVSRFGHKLAGPTFQATGKNVSQMVGMELINNAGLKAVTKEVAKRIALKTAEGLAFGAASAGVDALVDNYMRDLCEKIGSNILANIERDVNNHHISVTLKEAWDVLGKKEAQQVIDGLTKKAFAKQSYFEECVPIANKIGTVLSQGVGQAMEKCSKSGNQLTIPLKAITTVVKCAEFTAQIANIATITDTVLNDVDGQIMTTLKKRKRDGPRTLSDEEKGTDEEFEKFRLDAIDQWKGLLHDKVGRVISLHIKALLQRACTHLIRFAGRQIQAAYRYYKETGYLASFDQLQHDYKEKLRHLEESGESTKAKNHVTEKYHEDLRTLMLQTKNPELLAKIVRESIPMDLTCVSACTQVVDKLLKNMGIANVDLTIVVKGEGGIRQEFCTEAKGGIPVTIPLDLIDNHFEFSGGGASQGSDSSNMGNNCLYDALVAAFPQIREAGLTAEMFRSEVANCIETDPNIRYHIKQGWHRLPLRLGAYGGRRVVTVPTVNSINQHAEGQCAYQHTDSSNRGWNFDQSKDVDLRSDGPLTKEQIHSQRADAFNEAVNKINQHLSTIGTVSAPVTSNSFTTATKYDTVLCRGPFGQIQVVLFPVEIETTVLVSVPNMEGLVPYTLRIDVDSPHRADTQGPRGPHVGYDIIRTNRQAPKGVTGHILLNNSEGLPDRGRSRYTEPGSFNTVPISRLFSPPARPDTYFERVDASNLTVLDDKGNVGIRDEYRDQVRGRSFPTSDF